MLLCLFEKLFTLQVEAKTVIICSRNNSENTQCHKVFPLTENRNFLRKTSQKLRKTQDKIYYIIKVITKPEPDYACKRPFSTRAKSAALAS